MENRIIYVMGAARSGTTLLDIILGNATDIFSAGELNRFAKRGGIPHDARDETVENFWKQVKEDLAKENINDFDLYTDISKKFEYHTSLLNFFPSKKRKQIFNIYAAYQRKLFSNIAKYAAENFNKRIISDSSKYPMRGLLLSKIFGGHISFIYIKRNPFSVVESFQKKDIEQPPKNRLKANLYLLAINTIANKVLNTLRKNNKVTIIAYDDLVKNPVSTLSQIENDLDINLQAAKELIETNEPLMVGLLFDGNRLRLKNQILFNKETPVNKNRKIIDSFFYPLHKLMWYK